LQTGTSVCVARADVRVARADVGRCRRAEVIEKTTAPAIRPAATTVTHDDGGASPAADAGQAAAGGGQRGEHPQAQDQVTVRLPAEGAYLSVLRTATAGLAARLDFTLDEIEDLRIAVDEACAMLLSQAQPGGSLECVFALDDDAMTISVSAQCLAPQPPASDTFAWTVLSALAGSVEAHVGPGNLLTIVMRKTREISGSV
jgi:serine/threonine-protein kinase RsbW